MEYLLGDVLHCFSDSGLDGPFICAKVKKKKSLFEEDCNFSLKSDISLSIEAWGLFVSLAS